MIHRRVFHNIDKTFLDRSLFICAVRKLHQEVTWKMESGQNGLRQQYQRRSRTICPARMLVKSRTRGQRHAVMLVDRVYQLTLFVSQICPY